MAREKRVGCFLGERDYVREGSTEAFAKCFPFSSAALEKRCRLIVRENQNKSILFLSSSLPRQTKLSSPQTQHTTQTTFHEMKDPQQAWGLRLAQERTHDSQNSHSAEIRIPLDSGWGNEVCANVECCTSPCIFYTDAQRNGDCILWTDASFFPDSGRCAAAFGLECSEGIKISAFRVRGSAARGELLAIFAALKTYSLSDRNLTIFSDCQSAIKRIEKLISHLKTTLKTSNTSPLDLSPPSSSSPSSSHSLFSSSALPSSSLISSLTSLESKILPVLHKILANGRSVSLHWVKGHSGIVQNELLDQAAKKEAQNKNRESLFEEIPEMMGEVTLNDKMIENRDEICYTEWRPDLDKGVMKVAKSWMAKRVMAGIEQWRGLKPSWASSVLDDCVHCSKRHKLGFESFIRSCPSSAKFRKEIQGIWTGVTWNEELLEGRVLKSQVRELGAGPCGESREAIVKEARDRVRRWERALIQLRKSL